MKISEILLMADGTPVSFISAASKVKEDNASNGSPYLDLSIFDNSGKIFGKYWSVPSNVSALFQAPYVAEFSGVLSTYNKDRQITLKSVRPVDQIEYPITNYIVSAPISSPTMLDQIIDFAKTIADSEIQAIVAHCLSLVGKRILEAPAAKSVHHNFYGGLLYHILGMLIIADTLCRFRTDLDRDLLIAAIILHDLGKIEEMQYEHGIVSDYTFDGKMFGHIIIMDRWICEYAIKHSIVSNRKVKLLQHILLSHHNKGEWGSPVQPRTAEAVALHYIDQLDSKTQAATDAVKQSPAGDFGKRNYALENMEFYGGENK